jgi:hypothetical protein
MCVLDKTPDAILRHVASWGDRGDRFPMSSTKSSTANVSTARDAGSPSCDSNLIEVPHHRLWRPAATDCRHAISRQVQSRIRSSSREPTCALIGIYISFAVLSKCVSWTLSHLTWPASCRAGAFLRPTFLLGHPWTRDPNRADNQMASFRNQEASSPLPDLALCPWPGSPREPASP